MIDDAANMISWSFSYTDIDPPTAMHIHTGAAGVGGGIFVGLGVAGGPGTLAGSVATAQLHRLSRDVRATAASQFTGGIGFRGRIGSRSRQGSAGVQGRNENRPECVGAPVGADRHFPSRAPPAIMTAGG